MRILIVNAFEKSKRGAKQYAVLRELIASVLNELKVLNCNFIEREINRLDDVVVDWEHDGLNDASKNCCKAFDKFDFIFVSGDMKVLPWEPIATQVVTLIHMCKATNKPLFCSGFGAFSAIYTLSTKGARFHVLNGPYGDEIEKLPSFPRYSIGSGAYPSGWLDSETGDLYTYQAKQGVWKPVCNIGMYRIASTGIPSRNRHCPGKKNYARADNLTDMQQILEPLDEDAEIARIRSIHVQHPAVRGFKAQHFIMKTYPEWYLRSEDSLPSDEELVVIADGSKGAVLLAKDNMLIVSSNIDLSSSYSTSKVLLKNFVESSLSKAMAATVKLPSMLTFLFGADGISGGSYDSTAWRKPMSAPLYQTSIPSSLVSISNTAAYRNSSNNNSDHPHRNNIDNSNSCNKLFRLTISPPPPTTTSSSIREKITTAGSATAGSATARSNNNNNQHHSSSILNGNEDYYYHLHHWGKVITGGPVKVDPPAIGMFLQKGNNNLDDTGVDCSKLHTSRDSSTKGRKQRITVQVLYYH